MTNRKVNFHEKIISFLNSDPKIEEWWYNNKKNYTMDVPMMLVGEIEHLLKNFNQPSKWKKTIVSTTGSAVKIGNKFQVGDKALVGETVKRNDFMEHVLKVGQEVEIAGNFSGWHGHEAYQIRDRSGKLLTEILLAEELERITISPLKKILEDHELKNETLRTRIGLSQFEKTAIHYFHEEGEQTWLEWYDLLTYNETDKVQKMFQINDDFISRQRENNKKK